MAKRCDSIKPGEETQCGFPLGHVGRCGNGPTNGTWEYNPPKPKEEECTSTKKTELVSEKKSSLGLKESEPVYIWGDIAENPENLKQFR
jgi:hypothetical protein